MTEKGGPGAPRLRIARVGREDPIRPSILASIRAVYGRDPSPIRSDLDAGRARLHAALEGERLAGYLLLDDYRNPLAHVGNRIDARAVAQLLAAPDRKLWGIALLHGEPDTARGLAALGEAMLGAAAREDPGETLFLVSLRRGGDPRSRRLFRELGFREGGAPSWLLELDLTAAEIRSGRACDLEISWMEDPDRLPAPGVADAYNDIFAEGLPVLSPADIRALASGPSFAGEVSLLACEGASGAVVGLLLAGRRPGGVVHIDCVGIRGPWRGRGYVEAAFGPFRGRALAAGFRRATFVTGRPEVRRYAVRRFRARVVDELVWLLRPGGASGAKMGEGGGRPAASADGSSHGDGG